jgi:prephenate dehydrogenase
MTRTTGGKESQRLGAVDDAKYNLPASVRDAKIVILALPFAGMRETLEVIARDLQDGTLVLDTAPSKATVAAWAKELLPRDGFTSASARPSTLSICMALNSAYGLPAPTCSKRD